MASEKLKAILDELRDARATAKIVLEDVDPRVRAGVEGQVRQSQVRIKQIEDKYRNESVRTMYVVGLTGEHSADLATKMGNKVLCLDNRLISNIITDRINARQSARAVHANSFGGQEMNMLLDELNRIRVEYEIAAIPPMDNKGTAQLTSGLSLRDAVDTVLRKSFGSQLHSVALRKAATDAALADMTDVERLVVLVYNYTGTDGFIFPLPSLELDFSSPIGDNTVEDTLKKIKMSLKKPVTARKGENKHV